MALPKTAEKDLKTEKRTHHLKQQARAQTLALIHPILVSLGGKVAAVDSHV